MRSEYEFYLNNEKYTIRKCIKTVLKIKRTLLYDRLRLGKRMMLFCFTFVAVAVNNIFRLYQYIQCNILFQNKILLIYSFSFSYYITSATARFQVHLSCYSMQNSTLFI